jgi:hypothetical protein
MRHYISCAACHDLDPDLEAWASGEVRFDLHVLCTCPSGHITVAGILHHLPDILYQSAVSAYRKECYSESMLSFGASLERTYEIFVKAAWLKTGAVQESIDLQWREMDSQSERQFGAFCSAYLSITGKPWRLDAAQVKLRNKVVHKGYIASGDEVTQYANYVTEKIDNLLALLHGELSSECTEIYFHAKVKGNSAIKALMDAHPEAKFVGTSGPSLLDWNYGERKPVTFTSALAKAEQLDGWFMR